MLIKMLSYLDLCLLPLLFGEYSDEECFELAVIHCF